MIEVEELPVPPRLGEDAASADVAAAALVHSRCEELGYGAPEMRTPAERLHRGWADPFDRHRLFAVRRDGGIVGMGTHSGDEGASWLDVRVLPEHRGHGIGGALADRLEALARELGSTHAIVYAVSPDAPGEHIDALTGVGWVPAGGPEARFLRGRGYRLEQVNRASRLPLPVDVDELATRLAAATARSGPDYRLHRWVGTTPAERLDDLALLYTRMTTDAPQGGLGEPEDVHTAERVAEGEASARHGGLVLLTGAVEHVPTGRLVGFTRLEAPVERTEPVLQQETLVLREHRGHALGTVLKLAALELLAREHPGHPSVVTWNAEENRHMLAINEAVGFAPMGREGAWRLDLG